MLMWWGLSTASSKDRPPHASMHGPYSPLGSTMMPWSSGLPNRALNISPLLFIPFPAPGLPKMNPAGVFRVLRLKMMGLPESWFCP